MSIKTVEFLTETRDLIKDKDHFTQGHLAEEEAGAHCNPADSAAYRFCAAGALKRVASNHGIMPFRTYNGVACLTPYTDSIACLSKACEELAGSDHYIYVSDTYGHDVIIPAFDRAIELAKKADKTQSEVS